MTSDLGSMCPKYRPGSKTEQDRHKKVCSTKINLPTKSQPVNVWSVIKNSDLAITKLAQVKIRSQKIWNSETDEPA